MYMLKRRSYIKEYKKNTKDYRMLYIKNVNRMCKECKRVYKEYKNI